jgi:hypothetical protein
MRKFKGDIPASDKEKPSRESVQLKELIACGSTPKIDRQGISQAPRTKSTLRRCIVQED